MRATWCTPRMLALPAGGAQHAGGQIVDERDCDALQAPPRPPSPAPAMACTPRSSPLAGAGPRGEGRRGPFSGAALTPVTSPRNARSAARAPLKPRTHACTPCQGPRARPGGPAGAPATPTLDVRVHAGRRAHASTASARGHRIQRDLAASKPVGHRSLARQHQTGSPGPARPRRTAHCTHLATMGPVSPVAGLEARLALLVE
jgi:hypothetical protein